MSFETIQYETIDRVAVITLNRPDALNAMTMTMGNELAGALARAQGEGARAIVLTGAGRAFCSGGDLREMQQIAKLEGRIEAFFDEPLRLLHDSVKQICEIPVPVIAAVNGAASGAGCNLALACDFVLASDAAKFNEAFIRVGLSPDCGGTYFLPRLVGMRRAAELLMTGDVVDAARAADFGLINRVVPAAELINEALALAKRLAAMPTAAIGRIKKMLIAAATNSLADQLDLERAMQLESGQTMDFKEGVAAFLEKRAPDFQGG